ncbi:MAG: DUF4185 domain-containing protein [Deltaproteobacteria bacterium]|nr:DUF4185 domain-containing protein [Deltaproteobacteria bacterium]
MMERIYRRDRSKAYCSLIVFAAFVAIQLTSPGASAAEAIEVLFVSNGRYAQETAIEDHLVDTGVYNVTQLGDYQITGRTNLSPFDIIILTELAPRIPRSGIYNIKRSGKPVLIVEHSSYRYSYRLGLTTTTRGSGFQTDHLNAIDMNKNAEIFDVYRKEIRVFEQAGVVYGVPRQYVVKGVRQLFSGSPKLSDGAVLYDERRGYVSLGMIDAHMYSIQAWMLFDVLLNELHEVPAPWSNAGELWTVYEQSGLSKFFAAVRANPQAFPPDMVAETLWRDRFTKRLEPLDGIIACELELPGYEFELINPFSKYSTTAKSSTADHEVRRWADLSVFDDYTWGVGQDRDNVQDILDNNNIDVCGLDLGYEYCAQDLWFMGYNLDETNYSTINRFKTPAFDEVIDGVDLGISVRLGNGWTVMYMGDTWGDNSTIDCAPVAGFTCDDAIGVSTNGNDSDPSDGIDFRVVTENVGFDTKYKPLIIPGVNQVGGDLAPLPACVDGAPPDLVNPGCIGPFNTPTGAAYVQWKMSTPGDIRVPTVALWYAAASNDWHIPTAHTKGTSWLAFSTDGVEFGGLPGVPMSEPYGLFSNDKFIQVSPVTVTSEDLYDLCAASPDSVLCDLPHLDNPMTASDDGMLLYGTGQRYRCGPLYMGFITFPHLDVWYLRVEDGNPYWVPTEADATSISLVSEADADANCQQDPVWGFWRYEDPLNPNHTKQVFGELSVKLVKGDSPGQHRLVMLSNHMDDDNRVQYRTASLHSPHQWSTPESTTASGYGPYIIDRYTEIGDDDKLHMYHVISSWNGLFMWLDFSPDPPLPNPFAQPYGVFTRPLILESTGERPDWPPL